MTGHFMFGTSGIRGIVGQDVTCELAFRIGAAFGSMASGNAGHSGIFGDEAAKSHEIAIARDTRPSGRMLESALISGILFSGANAIRLGVATTPALAYQCARRKCGGVMITASHNPPQYNGFKLFLPGGRELPRADEQKIAALVSAGAKGAEWNKVGKVSIYRGAVGGHSSFLLSKIDAKLIAKKAPKVLIDCGNGAGSVQTPALLAQAGCQVISLNSENSGFFNRPLEPAAANLQAACKAVVACGADFGIAHDGDADRAVIIDEKGNLLGQDVQLCIMISDILSKKKGAIVSTVEASLSVREAVRRAGGKLLITPVGSIHVAEEAERHRAIFGGEPCGEYVFTDGIPCPDGPMAALKFVEIFCRKGKLSSLASKFRQYPIAREKFACNNARKADAMKKISEKLAVKGKKSALDGLRIDFDDGWLLVRQSGTEPYIRLTLECKNEKKLRQMKGELSALINSSIKAL